MIRRILGRHLPGAAPALARQADVRFAAVALVLSVLALLFSGWLIVDAPIPLDRDLLAMSPRVFPYLILLGTVVVAAIFLGFRIRDTGSESAVAVGTADVAASRATTVRQLVFLIISVACALLLNTLGFIITMFILMASTSVLVGNRRPLQILGISLAIPLGFYIAVTHVMRTALPEIDLVQRALAPLLRLLPAF
ncbi:MAG: tripartite tricarboxylate transporter TctB family protein [Rhodospirillaceae bacterium]|nr:tripartite tricarboxylate transporter TctB family protein [Rhodospirillaceae bacterium]